MLPRLILPLLCALFSLSATAQETVLRAGHVFNSETGTYMQDQYVRIEEGVIQGIGPWSAFDHDGTYIDLSDKYILPGLIDAHVHLTSDAGVHGYKRLTRSLARQAITGARNARRTVEAGFTTIRNLGAPGYADIALRDAIEAGDIPGPRIIASGPSLGSTGGHCDNNLLPAEYGLKAEGVADGPWALRAKVREVRKYGANLIKICATGGVLSKGTQVGAQQLTLEEMQAIVAEARLSGMKIAAHAHGNAGIRTAIEAGVDSVEHASFISEDVIAQSIKNGTYLSMDIYVSDYILSEGEKAGILPESLEKERVVGKIQRENFRKAVKAGAKIAYGTDAGVYPHGDNARQMHYMVNWGMTPAQAIQAATLHNADLLGLSDKIGQIKPGFYADIIAVSTDPIEDIQALERIDWVMKAGTVFKQD